MDEDELIECVRTDPSLSAQEKEMSIGFSKADDKATLYTCIASQVKRAIQHTDVQIVELYAYNTDNNTRWRTTVEEFGGGARIVGLKAKLPIESLKVQSNPRSQRSYASIISPQTEVSFENND
jgi:hypothetical protein